ncbi:MAG: hypothetical protein DRN66_00640 [Candidatus Nanohalarchaeota archaeon]|nr:MAG: hypothetical protein DRN66_00640 [Candidatus Nanohaloarchaeota archaeon]
MRIVALFTFALFVSYFFGTCFADVSNPHIFPLNATVNGKVMVITSIRINDGSTDSCDLSKPYNFSYEYNYSSARIKGDLSELSYVYPQPNEKIRLYGIELNAKNNANLSIIIECSDVFSPGTQHSEKKTSKINTGNLEFPYAEDKFYFKNKPNDTIRLYPFEIITVNGKNLSDEEIQNYTLAYSLYNLYTDNAIKRKIFQKQLDLYYPSSSNIFAFDASCPIGYIVFEGSDGVVLGGKYFLVYTIPFSFSLTTNSNLERGDYLSISANYTLYYDSFPDNISIKIKQPDNEEVYVYLLKSSNYQTSYLVNQTGTYILNATAQSGIYTDYASKYIDVAEVKNISFSTDKNIYYVGETIHLDATLLENGIPQPSNDDIVQIKYGSTIYAINETLVKTNNTCAFSIPLDANFSTNIYTVLVSMKGENGKIYTKEKSITIHEHLPLGFAVVPLSINVTLSGEKIEKTINVSNTGGENISNITITVSEILKDIVSLNTTSFSLNISESKTIHLFILPSASELTEGEILLTTTGFYEKINVAVHTDIFRSAELKQKEYSCQALLGEETTVQLMLNNTGTSSLDNITFFLSEGLDNYFFDSTIPDYIEADEEKSLLFNFGNFNEEETITGTITINSNGIANTADITIIAVEDVSPTIDAIKNRKEELALRLGNLKSTTEKDSIEDLFDELQASVSDLNSDYNNQNYLDAKGKIAPIENQLDSIEALIIQIESSETSVIEDSYCGDGVCNADEDENICSEDCSTTNNEKVPRKTSWVIIAGILVAVVVVFIVATSLVPEDYAGDEEE